MEDLSSRTPLWLEQQRHECLEIMQSLKKKDPRHSEYADRFASLTREINKRSAA